jgi:hypothetical protein
VTHAQPNREAGKCPVCGDAPESKFGVYCSAHKDRTNRPPKEQWTTPQTAAAPEGGGDDTMPEETAPTAAGGETAPHSPYDRSSASPPPSMGTGDAGGRQPGRWRRWLGAGSKGAKAGATPSAVRPERAPKPTKAKRNGPRISTADDAGEIYGQLAGRLSMTRHYPTGRMMQWQAPMFGVVFDNAIAGTLVDRMGAQPLMRGKEKYEPLAELIIVPALVAGMTNARDAQNWTAFNTLAPMLEYAIDRHLVSILPAAAQAQAIKDEREQAIGESWPELAGATTPDGQPLSPAQAMIAMLFAPPEWPQGQPDTNPEEGTQNGEAVPTDAPAHSQSPMD